MLKPKIKVRLAELNKRQIDTSIEMEMTQKQFSNWVTGRSYPRLNEAFKLAKYLGCKVDDLWEYDED